MDFKDMRVRCFDYGLFGFMLEDTDFGKKEMYVPWEASFPTSDKHMIGLGIPGIKRLDYFEDDIDDVDLFIFPDIYKGALQEDLRRRGKLVFGSGRAEILEIDRELFKDTLADVGLPVVPSTKITGIDDLREYLQSLPRNAKLVIKSSCFRGDQETEVIDGKNNTVEDALDWLNALAVKLGARKDYIEFLCETAIESDCEPGYSTFFSDEGGWGDWGLLGYEKKDAALIGRMMRTSALPAPIKNVNDKLAPVLKKYGYRGVYVMEYRFSKKGVCFPIDACMRAGSPDAESLWKSVKNITQVIYDVANGRQAKMKVEEKYAAILKFTSETLEKDFDLEVKFPKELAPWVRVYNKYQHGSKIYSIAQDGNNAVGAVVAIGRSIDEVKDLCLKRIEQVHCKKMSFDEKAFDWITDSIEAGNKYGVRI